MAGALGRLRGGGRDTTCIEQSLLSVVGSWQSAAAAAECVEPEPLQNQPVLARSRELDERMRIPSQETGSWYPRNSRPRRRFPRPSLLGLRCSPPTNHLGSTRSGSCGGSKKVGWAGGTPPPSLVLCMGSHPFSLQPQHTGPSPGRSPLLKSCGFGRPVPVYPGAIILDARHGFGPDGRSGGLQGPERGQLWRPRPVVLVLRVRVRRHGLVRRRRRPVRALVQLPLQHLDL